MLKTIVAFLNTYGGILVIGYDEDNRSAVGLEVDFSSFKERKDWDGWLQHLTNLVVSKIGASFINFIMVEHAYHQHRTLAKITVGRSPEPVYLKMENENQFFVRTFNVTRPLKGKDMVDYIRHNWKGK